MFKYISYTGWYYHLVRSIDNKYVVTSINYVRIPQQNISEEKNHFKTTLRQPFYSNETLHFCKHSKRNVVMNEYSLTFILMK